MKRILRHFVIDSYCIYLISIFASGIEFRNGLNTLLTAGIAVTIVSLVAKPVINILLLPINLITFGIFRWLGSAFVLYITSIVVQSFKVTSFHFLGFSSKWIDIPSVNFEGIMAYVAFSLMYSIISSTIYWLIK